MNRFKRILPKKQCNVVSITQIEYQPSNILDRHFQLMLFPLNFIHYICLSSRYTFRNNLVTPRGKLSNFLSIIGTFIFIFVSIYRVLPKILDPDNHWYLSYNHFSTYFDIWFYGIGYIIHNIVLISRRRNYVEYILKLNKIFVYFKTGRDFKNIIVYNWFYMAVFIVYNVCYYSHFYIVLPIFGWMDYTFDFLFTNFDLNVVFGIFMVKLLREYVLRWGDKLRTHSDRLWDRCDNRDMDKKLKIYNDIIDAYKLLHTLIQAMILFHTIHTTFQYLIFLAIVMEIFQSNNEEFMRFLSIAVAGLVVRLGKNLLLQSLLGYQCERFYMAVEDTRAQCTTLAFCSENASTQRLCKQVVLLVRRGHRRTGVCGIYRLDVTLPLQLLAFLTTYTLVILQFALEHTQDNTALNMSLT